MKEITLTVKNEIGLHARPATFFIEAANSFKSSIWIEKNEIRSNAKSLLGILSLGIIGGSIVKIFADGPDEDLALQTLKKFIDSGFSNESELVSWIDDIKND